MPRMTRFGVSLEQGLLAKFDEHISKAGYRNRSAALREVVRNYLVSREWETGTRNIAAVVSLVFHNGSRDALRRLEKVRVTNRARVLSTTRHHLHAQYTLEVIVLFGPGSKVRSIAEQLLGCRGVVNGSVAPAVTGPPCGGLGQTR